VWRSNIQADIEGNSIPDMAARLEVLVISNTLKNKKKRVEKSKMYLKNKKFIHKCKDRINSKL